MFLAASPFAAFANLARSGVMGLNCVDRDGVPVASFISTRIASASNRRLQALGPYK